MWTCVALPRYVDHRVEHRSCATVCALQPATVRALQPGYSQCAIARLQSVRYSLAAVARLFI